MMPTLTTTVPSPIGPLLLSASQGALTGVQMQNQRHFRELPEDAVRDDEWFADIRAQLDAYFCGDLREFDVTLNLVGTDFQRRVWAQLQAIPYGETISYGELARRVGRPRAARATGSLAPTVPSPATAEDSTERRGSWLTRRRRATVRRVRLTSARRGRSFLLHFRSWQRTKPSSNDSLRR